MAKVTITVCDVCHDPERTTATYRMGQVGALRSVDLCNEHAKPIEDILAAKPAKSRAPRRRTFDQAVTTIEEIEARKKKQAKT